MGPEGVREHQEGSSEFYIGMLLNAPQTLSGASRHAPDPPECSQMLPGPFLVIPSTLQSLLSAPRHSPETLLRPVLPDAHRALLDYLVPDSHPWSAFLAFPKIFRGSPKLLRPFIDHPGTIWLFLEGRQCLQIISEQSFVKLTIEFFFSILSNSLKNDLLENNGFL